MNKWNKVLILAGSNSGNTFAAMEEAVKLVRQIPHRKYLSSDIYISEAWGKSDEPDYMNRLIIFDSWLPPILLMKNLLRIEHAFGRVRKEKWGSRTLDLDILYYGQQTIDSALLTLPHKHIADRHFVLTILTDYDPDFIHPVLGKTNRELLDTCPDNGKIIRLKS